MCCYSVGGECWRGNRWKRHEVAADRQLCISGCLGPRIWCCCRGGLCRKLIIVTPLMGSVIILWFAYLSPELVRLAEAVQLSHICRGLV